MASAGGAHSCWVVYYCRCMCVFCWITWCNGVGAQSFNEKSDGKLPTCCVVDLACIFILPNPCMLASSNVTLFE